MTRKNIFVYIIQFLLLFSSSSMAFLAGSFSSSAKREELSNYISKVVKNYTQNNSVMAITVMGDEDHHIVGSDDEFLRTYGVFKQTNSVFASGYNIRKNHYVYFSEYDFLGNLSIMYTGADMSMEYNGHYKQWTYPYELMFMTPRLYTISSYMIYLSQSQADVFLENRGTLKTNGKYTLLDYQSLIESTFNMSVDGIEYKCVVCNVYYETNYYYEDIKELANDFVLCAYYCPGKMERENMYMFREYPYQNEYFMNHIVETYPNKKYILNINKNNITNDVDDSIILSFYYNDYQTSTTAFCLLVITSLLLLTMCSMLNILFGNKSLFQALLLLGFFIPYLIFYLISSRWATVLYFSNIGISLLVYFILYYLVTFFIIRFISNKVRKQQ